MKQENYYSIKPFGATPSDRQIHHLEMGKKAFFHFGVNTFSGKEWGLGDELEQSFNPTDCDVRSWIRDIKRAGFKHAILTAKHHDGFCLWPSKYTTHTVANSPYKDGKGDIVKEFTDACHEYGMSVGIYLSPWDRHSEFWGKDEYSIFYAKQLTELLTNYGKIDEVWWDGAGSTETRYDWGLWAYLVRTYQPTAVMFGAMGASPYVEVRWVGNEAGFAADSHYASIDIEDLYGQNREILNTGKLNGNRYVPAEVDVSIRPGWFYHKSQDDAVKSVQVLDKLWFKSIGSNAQMLLNFPPDTEGKLCPIDVNNAIISNMHIEKMLAVNYIDTAEVSADSQYNEFLGIEKALLNDDSLFYATDEKADSVSIDITLKGDDKINCLILGEKVELGERITSFKLENLDTGSPEVLSEGGAVGYKKAVLFDSQKYKKLRLTIKGAVAPLTLRHIGLYFYEEGDGDQKEFYNSQNLAKIKGSHTDFSQDKKSAVINFGGIYPFSRVDFKTKANTEYKISAFDGAEFYEIGSGKSNNGGVVVLRLHAAIKDAYQIKIEAQEEVSDFSVM